jgi:cysteinyl-tRNA synthetase
VDGEPDPAVLAGREAFLAALADDFNTPRAMAEIYDLVTEGNKRPLAGAHAAIAELLYALGLASLAAVDEPRDAEADRLVREREEARAARDFDRADRLRDELAARGYAVRDTPQGPKLVPR